MPRFVILFHDHPFPHWDLMLETGDRLRTWRLLEQPAAQSQVPAEQLPEHRLLYLDYEGPVSGNRGSVSRWDTGTFEPANDDGAQLRVELHGTRLRLSAELHAFPTGELCWQFGSAAGPAALSDLA